MPKLLASSGKTQLTLNGKFESASGRLQIEITISESVEYLNVIYKPVLDLSSIILLLKKST